MKKNIVLTGFRDKELDKLLSKYNMEINDTINNNTIYVLFKGDKKSNKLEIAKKKNIKVLDVNIFVSNIKKYLEDI